MPCCFSGYFKPFLPAILSFLLMFPSAGHTNPIYHYKQIGIEQGLSQSTVTALFRDSRGLLWIGTRSGLNRFDKSEIRTFYLEPGNDNSLPGNTVYTIAEDIRSNIWIGTNNGLTVYNPALDRFTFRVDDGVHTSLVVDDMLLFGGTKCIYRYRAADDVLIRIPIELGDETGQVYYIRDIQADANGTIVLGASNGHLYYYRPDGDTFTRDPEIRVPFLYSMCLCSDGNRYISSYKTGLYCYDSAGRLTGHWTSADSGLSSNIIGSMIELNGQLLLATEGGGICVFDLNDRTFSTICHTPGDPTSLPTNSLTLLYQDYNDNLWAGTVRNGLLGVREVFIKSFGDVPPVRSGVCRGLSEKSITSLFEDYDGTLWVGTDGGGINAYDPRTETFRHFENTYGESIFSITDLDDETLLLSVFNKGVFYFSKATGRMSPFVIVNKQYNQEERLSGITPAVHRVARDKIYILSKNIHVYRPSTGVFTQIHALPGEVMPETLFPAYSDEAYLYGFSKNEVYAIDQQTDKLKLLTTLGKGETITALCCKGDGKLWISSDWGLSVYDRTGDSLARIRTKLFNSVSYMLSDGPDRLWICANNMLFSYDIGKEKFSVWDESDGFAPNEILKMLQNRPRGRYLYFGGVNGLVAINRSLVSEQDDTPVVLLQEAVLNGRPVLPKHGGRYRIPYNYTSLVISSYANGKDIFRKVLFRYTIKGPSVQTIETFDRSLNLPMLPPGDYTISVACNLKNGEWSESRELACINVVPPWYRSTWFIICMLFLALMVLVLIILYIYRRSERKFRWKVKEYEQKINENKIQFLVNISHELRTPLTLIYAPLKRLIKGFEDNDPVKESLTDIYHQARCMRDIINMVLDINKLDRGGFGIALTVRPFNAWLGDLVDTFVKEFAENGVELAFVPDDAVGNVPFDEAKLRIVVSNLLANALKFSPAGTQVYVCTELCSGMVRVSVSDQGIGLKNVDIDQLFSRFYQGEHNQRGSGIGLSYSRQLVELHGGSIRALDNDSGGATFRFEIPQTASGAIEPADAQFPAASGNRVNLDESVTFSEEDLKEFCSHYSILVVEDNTEFRRFMRTALREYFKIVYSAEDGVRGLELTRSKHPDIVVSDVMMPGMNGFEMCRRIKEDVEISHSMVILLTAVGDPASISLGYKLGADFYLAKPFEMDMLLTLIYNQLKNRERVRHLYANSMTVLSPVETTVSSADEHFLLELNRLIAENMSNTGLDVNFLIDRLAVGRTTFYQKVKILTGMSVNDYINKMRIDRAAFLLLNSAATVSEIADEVGYAYQRYFSTLFKQMTGMTPTEYRQRAKEESAPRQ